MTIPDLIADIRSRINPAYATTLGTESYERRMCAEALEAQQAEIEWRQQCARTNDLLGVMPEEAEMPWYTTADARRDAEKQRPIRERDVHAGCWMCGVGRFSIMPRSDCLWRCDRCGYIGHLKVIPQPHHTKKHECSSFCAEGEKCSITADGRCDAELTPNVRANAEPLP